MKKLLSMALAIAMVLSLMPMSFAEGEAALDKSGVYVEYDIMSHYGTLTIAKILTYDATNNFFKYQDSSANLGYHATSKCVQLTKDNWLIFKINVPVAGKYDIKIKNYLGGKGGTLDAYIFPNTVTPNEGAIIDDYHIGSVNCSSSSGGNNGATSGIPNSFEDKAGNPASYTFPTAGEYYIGFKAVGNNGYVGDIVLDGGTGYALIGDMTIEPESVGVGENAQATATAYKSDYAKNVKIGTNADETEVTEFIYTSSKTDVATVDPTTGEITAKKAGTTTITATAEGAVNSLSCELEVTAAKSGVTVEYDIMSHKGQISSLSELNYERTNGFFDYAKASATGLGYHDGTTCIDLGETHWIIFKINVPVEGKYDIKIKNHIGNKGKILNAYVFSDTVTPNADALSESNYIGYVDCNATTGTDGKENANQFIDKAGNPVSYTFPTAGEYYIGFKAVEGKGFVGNIVLAGGSGNVLMPYFDGNTTLRNGETATLSGYLSSTATAADVTYAPSNDCVTVGTDGTITAVAPGKATVTMTAADSTVVAGSPYTVEIAVPDADLQAAFDAEPIAKNDYVAPTVAGLNFDGDVLKATDNRNGTFKLEANATDDEGTPFLYWAKGNTNEKRIISFNNVIDDYVPAEEGRNYLIAVYESDVSADTAEYYNANGQRIATGAVGGEKPALPSMAGYGEAKNWEQYSKTNIWVAQYGDEPKCDNVTVTVVGGDGTDTVPFGTSVTCKATEENFKCWTKKGVNEEKAEIVSVDKNYTFKAWEDCIVTAVYTEHNPLSTAMKIIIDSFTAGSETGIMAEFIGIDNAVEKGIIWKTNTAETKIAMTTSGNQFTVIADKAGEYIGYAILKDGNAYSIITDGSYEKE